ncbi:MAG TPA: DNA helicase RecQ [Clostridiales bacterium]|nr:DNA helicase RecQ [Clostridiales bacterium]
MDKFSILKQYFGHTVFRPGQESLIDGILSGQDVLGVMPTGSGKSLCYQIPALLMPGITLVVSPLISLMKDQVAALLGVGIKAAFINSSLTSDQLQTVYQRLREDSYKIVYIAPERLASDGFIRLMQEQQISLIAVDEAHCISQWGQDFRPSYLKIVEFIEKLPSPPILSAFTATATAQVRQDIINILKLKAPLSIVTGFDRPNLFFDVQRPKNKMTALRSMIGARYEKSGIVYCATRVAVERVTDDLNAHGIEATRYHAGLSDEERRCNQDDFQFDRKPVMVATNAFGMGIDKSNVSFVIHYNMPKSLEAYYQEAGRVGRDGEKADCILLFAAGDITTAKFLIQNSGDNEELSAEEQDQVKKRDYQRLEQMIGYCKTTSCLRNDILDYFGQNHEDPCENCGNCKNAFTMMDITLEAQMILSCITRVRRQLGYYVGATLIGQVLRGSKDKRILELNLDGLSTYGLMRQESRSRIGEYIDFLDGAGYLYTNPQYATLELTEQSAKVLFQGETVTMPVKSPPSLEGLKKKGKKQFAQRNAAEESGLLTALKALRTRLAQEEGVPAYIIFSNATLADMASKAPHNIYEFLEVSGVGEVKAARYGEAFLGAIVSYEEGTGIF